MTAMNAQPNPDDEERKGCSGHVGKMIFSAGTAQLAIVAYVPKPESNKSAEKVDVTAWTDAVCKAVGGEVMTPKAPADSPAHGGHTVVAVCKSDAEKGKFALKDKDAAMAAAFNFLREKGVSPPSTLNWALALPVPLAGLLGLLAVPPGLGLSGLLQLGLLALSTPDRFLFWKGLPGGRWRLRRRACLWR